MLRKLKEVPVEGYPSLQLATQRSPLISTGESLPERSSNHHICSSTSTLLIESELRSTELH